MTHLDPLDLGLATGLPLRDRLESLARSAFGRGHHLVLLAASVSNADELADVLGHDGLAAVGSAVAGRLDCAASGVHVLQATPLGGLVAAVVVEPGTSATARAEALAAQLRGFVRIGGERVWPVITVALRRCRPDDEGWQALREVRGVLFEAGRRHRGCVRWQDEPDDRAGGPGRALRAQQALAVRRELDLVGDLATALHEDPAQITLAYQPVVDLRSRTLVSAEALMRWHHPQRGPVPPCEAVAAAERSGLIHDLGRLVLDLALEQTAAWLGHLGPAYRTHVNVSALELQRPGYVEGVAAALERAGVAPERLLLEITETALLTQDQHVLTTLYRLRALGVGLGIDDFGTGYSSISQLHRLPVDTVKIDRSLVCDIATSATDFDLIRTVLGLLNTTQVTVVAEGIEDAVQASHLQAVGAMFGQGYLLGRPVPPEVFLPDVAPLHPVAARTTTA